MIGLRDKGRSLDPAVQDCSASAVILRGVGKREGYVAALVADELHVVHRGRGRLCSRLDVLYVLRDLVGQRRDHRPVVRPDLASRHASTPSSMP